MGRPRKVEYPIRLQEMLRIILRDKRPEDRMKIFREYQRYYLNANLRRQPSEDELEAEIKKWQDTEIYGLNPGFIDNLKFDFLPKYLKENRSKRGELLPIAAGQKMKKLLDSFFYGPILNQASENLSQASHNLFLACRNLRQAPENLPQASGNSIWPQFPSVMVQFVGA